jgi:hypothetical protein
MQRLRIGFLMIFIILMGLLGSAQTASVQADPVGLTVSGTIGGYAEQVDEAALAVEANGRIHALWTGKLNPYFKTIPSPLCQEKPETSGKEMEKEANP